MAKQDGFVKLKGTIDDVNFYRTKDGYMARKKTAIDPKRLERDPAFARTREAMSNFRKAATAGKLLRQALRSLVTKASDKRVSTRLSSQMHSVIKADAINKRGLKNVIDGETELLNGFEFNSAAPLYQTFGVKYEASIDRISGVAQVKIPSYNIEELIKAPFESSHFRFHIGGAEVDFEQGAYVVDFKNSEPVSVKLMEGSALDLSVNLPANSKHPLFLVLGVTFLVEDLQEFYPIKNNAYNALAIVAVSGV